MSKQRAKRQALKEEKSKLAALQAQHGCDFPGCHFTHPNRKEWMSTLPLDKVRLKDVVWPGTHDSGTNGIGNPITRPFAECQSLSIYEQLCAGVRALDIRVEESRRVCHGVLKSYSVDRVLAELKRFLGETASEVVLLEVRTEYGHADPPGFDAYLIAALGEAALVPQDEGVLDASLAEVIPRGRVICVWKPIKDPAPAPGSPLWSSGYLRDNWIDTDMPAAKFESNLAWLERQEPCETRRFFYRVENTATPQTDNPVVCVVPVTKRIKAYGRLFIAEAYRRGIADRLQIFSEDYVEDSFIDACIGVTMARVGVGVDDAK